MSSDMEDALLDPVTFELLREACILSCGHSFNASTLSEWLSKESRCPLCQTDVVDGDRKPNYALRSVVQAFESAQASPSAPEIVANEAAASSSSEVNSPPAPIVPERPPSPEMTLYNPNMLVPNVVWEHKVQSRSIVPTIRKKGRNIFTALAAAYKQEQLLAFRRNALENFIYSKQVILASMTRAFFYFFQHPFTFSQLNKLRLHEAIFIGCLMTSHLASMHSALLVRKINPNCFRAHFANAGCRMKHFLPATSLAMLLYLAVIIAVDGTRR